MTACPGDRISITCIHNITDSSLTRWELPGVALCLVAHDGSGAPDCPPFTITMISDNSGTTVSSTVEITVTDRALDGEMVECRADLSGPLVESVNISVLGKCKCLFVVGLVILCLQTYSYSHTQHHPGGANISVHGKCELVSGQHSVCCYLCGQCHSRW